jgi:YHS domain-containing protein
MSDQHSHSHEHGDEHGHGHGHGHENADAAQRVVEDDLVAECVVMPGTPVVKEEAELAGLVREYEGKKYYLCCDACGPLFDADPAKYAHA